MDLAQIIMYVLAAIGALLTILIAYGAVVGSNSNWIVLLQFFTNYR